MSSWRRDSFLRLLILRLQLAVPNAIRRALPRTPDSRPDKYPIPDCHSLRSLLFPRTLSVIRVVLL